MRKPHGRVRGRPKAFHDKTTSSLIRSLDRALGVLKVVANGNGQSLTEVAEVGDQASATVYRVLTTFRKHRFVDFDEKTQLWWIGAEAHRVGAAFLRRTRIVERSRPVMERVLAETGETANLAIIDQGEVIFISQAETHEPIRAFFRPGTRGPIHASGIGKAILAFQTQSQIRSSLSSSRLNRYTANTITSEEELAAELDATRRRGWAVDNEERTAGMRCIAAPIFNQFGEAVAGISVSGPSVRMTPQNDPRLGALIRGAADEITHTMGGILP